VGSESLAVRVVNYQGHPDQHFGCVTYSQHGEDLMILNLFKLMGIEKPTYLDLGAHHPFNISNTALLYSRGCRGVNVEANPLLYPAFLQHRPDDVNLKVGIGLECGEKSFFMYDDQSGRNTFSETEVKSLEGIMAVQKVVRLPIVTIDSIIEKTCSGLWPDLLSIDIEGLDFEVLRHCKFDGGPKIIVVETRREHTTAMSDMLGWKNYFPHCRMGENVIYIQEQFLKFLF
jgi:FkbM family methyltransferase